MLHRRIIIMKIRYKLLLALSLITVIIMASTYLIAQTIMLNSISRMDEQTSSSNAERFVRNLNIALTTLNNTVNDWAQWDETYEFVKYGNPKYINNNLSENSFINLNINLILFLDNSGNIVFFKMYCLSQRGEVVIDKTVLEEATNEFFLNNNTVTFKEGIILINNSPMMIAASPILTSLLEGPSPGTLIMGRYLDTLELERLSKSVGLPLSISIFSEAQADPDFQFAKEYLSVEKPIFTRLLNETSLAGYVLLTDLMGNPVSIVRVYDYRVYYAQGMDSMSYTAFSILTIGVTTFFVTAILLDRLVVYRLSVLNNTVIKIKKTGDNSQRVPVYGNDELSSLSANINSMLDVVDEHTVFLEKTVKDRTNDLSQNQQKLASILLASPDAIIAMDLEGNITECNDQVTQLCGFDRSYLLGKSALTFIAEEYSQLVFDQLINSIKGNQGITRFEARLKKSDNTSYPAEISVNLIKNEEKELIGFVAIIRDLSERKQLEQRLFKSERLAAIGELAGMVGHDLRNPLTSIKNASYIIKKKYHVPDSKVEEMFGIIDNSIEYSNKIVSDLLDYSRAVHLDFMECTPKSLLKEALSMIKMPNNVELIDNTDDTKMNVDITKMVRVFINLIRNALEALSIGGFLEISSREDNGEITFSFKDNGQGISKEDLSKIFNPLFTTKAQGMGFGLSISKRFVEAHGGRISVKSILGVGTTFTLTIPKQPSNMKIK